jgi:hypothetical protein
MECPPPTETFSNLTFSARRHRPLQSASGLGFSTILHVLVVLVVARETLRAPEAPSVAMARELVDLTACYTWRSVPKPGSVH